MADLIATLPECKLEEVLNVTEPPLFEPLPADPTKFPPNSVVGPT